MATLPCLLTHLISPNNYIKLSLFSYAFVLNLNVSVSRGYDALFSGVNESKTWMSFKFLVNLVADSINLLIAWNIISGFWSGASHWPYFCFSRSLKMAQ